MQPQIIFIDWDGTLSTSRFWGHWADSPELAPHYAAIQRVFFESSPENLENWMRGRLTADMVVRFVATKTGIPGPVLLEGLFRSCELTRLHDPEVMTYIAELRRRGVKVAIATDNMDVFVRWTVPALNLRAHFDDILDSHSLRALKRDIDQAGRSPFFTAYLEGTQIPASQALLIDDGAHNSVVGAIGMSFKQVTAETSLRDILSDLLHE
ncbi:MAG TPA: haloacid dehalogenase-like hydrolase [Bacillota bacterium]|nr:haloacid dehalogenase-like hydrolase [Bacillota bacterium]HSX36543.1 haloacid dehalogenase-like hydrolase [Patescibacteria group bacterium]